MTPPWVGARAPAPAWPRLRRSGAPLRRRRRGHLPDWRGAALPFPAGVLAVAATLVALEPLAALDALGAWDVLGLAGAAGIDPVGAALLLGFGVAFLGLLDDLLGARAARLARPRRAPCCAAASRPAR